MEEGMTSSSPQKLRVVESGPLRRIDQKSKKWLRTWSVIWIITVLVSLGLTGVLIYVLIENLNCSHVNGEVVHAQGSNESPSGDISADNPVEWYVGSSLDVEDDEISPNQTVLQEFVSNLNCESLNDVLKKLQEEQVTSEIISRLRNQREVRRYLIARGRQLKCDDLLIERLSINRETRSSNTWPCREGNVGDGWCDQGCNTAQYRFDDGDCCKQTCEAKERIYPCGLVGYDCKLNIPQYQAPSWFTNGNTQLCYEWYPDGDGGQCGGGAARRLCAAVDRYTGYYRDDTDGRDGGCRMRWGITASGADEWFNDIQICYSWYADGDGGQCGGGARRELCASVNSYTGYYRDDTDGRDGGCRMSWKLKVPDGLQARWMYNVKLCYQWYPDGDGGQCGVSGTRRVLCASANQWTPYYRDDTDGRDGGCRMRWGLCLNDCA